jgi:hypothetical protein
VGRVHAWSWHDLAGRYRSSLCLFLLSLFLTSCFFSSLSSFCVPCVFFSLSD